ncbi:citrate synthase [Desulfobotulus alkaliphilus]|uniref:Citrate synthase n=1 Tax=Desulfobotulus alkaliphilus TaxID=622671 RepID=A0A562RMK7_9BACT|nr:citrate synthase [Desulfobotulus alkaliphilus]TWI70308.1 citrate synthase [Desulfobotulus alkaliphilus]
MSETVKLIIEGKEYELPVIVGTEGEKAFDITSLRQKTGYITYDPGFGNTGSCASAITFMDGERGILRYRGIPIEDLAENATFIETAYLLINGHLPTLNELNRTRVLLNDFSLIHESMQVFFQNFPRASHPMGILSGMIMALRSFYPDMGEEDINIHFLYLLSKVRTMAAMSYRMSRGEKVVYPRHDLSYCANFLNMMFDSPVHPYIVDEDLVRALNVFLILHADHEQNCSTSAVRVVGSSKAPLYASIAAGVSALWGPLHGGANQAVIEMLEKILKEGATIDEVIRRAKDRKDPFRLMGFGHRVYKTYDPRAKIIKKMCDKILEKLKIEDPLLDIAKKLEEVALTDPYFVDHNLYPNVDFYSGIVLRAMRIPTNMFPVMFAIGRLPGWIAQWKESMEDPSQRISRPRQIYTGLPQNPFQDIMER